MEYPAKKPFSQEIFLCNAFIKFLIWLCRYIYTTVIFPQMRFLIEKSHWIMFPGEYNSMDIPVKKKLSQGI